MSDETAKMLEVMNDQSRKDVHEVVSQALVMISKLLESDMLVLISSKDGDVDHTFETWGACNEEFGDLLPVVTPKLVELFQNTAIEFYGVEAKDG